LFLAVVLVVSDVSQSLMLVLRQVLGEQVDVHVHELLLQKAATLDMAFFETSSFYDQLENAKRDAWRIRNLPSLIVDTSGQLLALVATFGLLMRLYPLALPLLLMTCLPQLIVSRRSAAIRFLKCGQGARRRNAWSITW
jgi:ATP-binding cassette subfamily B protein